MQDISQLFVNKKQGRTEQCLNPTYVESNCLAKLSFNKLFFSKLSRAKFSLSQSKLFKVSLTKLRRGEVTMGGRLSCDGGS